MNENQSCSQNSCRTLCLLDDQVSRTGQSSSGALERLCVRIPLLTSLYLCLKTRTRCLELTGTSLGEHCSFSRVDGGRREIGNSVEGWVEERRSIRSGHPLQASTKSCLPDRSIDAVVWRTDRFDRGKFESARRPCCPAVQRRHTRRPLLRCFQARKQQNETNEIIAELSHSLGNNDSAQNAFICDRRVRYQFIVNCTGIE